MSVDNKLCGARIRAIRKDRKMTAGELAERVGIGEVSLLHIECGSRGPSLQTLYSIANVLGASMDFLSGRVNKPNDYVPTPEIEEHGFSDKQSSMLKDIAKAVAPIIKKNV